MKRFACLVLLTAISLVIAPLCAAAAVPPKISGMSAPMGVHFFESGSIGARLSRLNDLGNSFGMVRLVHLFEEWEDTDFRPTLLSDTKRIAAELSSKDSWLLLCLRGQQEDNPSAITDAQYAEFCGGMARALWAGGYRNIIFELWNEPNLYFTAQSYAARVNVAAAAIRSASEYPVCTGGISEPMRPYWSSTSGWHVDVMKAIDWNKVSFFGYHAYGTSPERIEGYYADECIAFMRDLLAAYAPGLARDVLMTEMGWCRAGSNGCPYSYDDSTRAALYARMALIHIRNSVESAAWFDYYYPTSTDPYQLPSLALKTAIRLQDNSYGFGGNPKDYAYVTGNAPFVGVNVTNMYTDTLGRVYSAKGQIRVALWRPVNSAGEAQNADVTIPSGYPYAYYNRVDDAFAPVRLAISGNRISKLLVSGMPLIMYLVKNPYSGDGIEYLYPPRGDNEAHAMTSSQIETFRLQVKNTGFATWSNTGASRVRIIIKGTDANRFKAPDWPADNVAGYLKEASVPPGGTGTFEWSMRAPQVSAITTFKSIIVASDTQDGFSVCTGMAHYYVTVQPAEDSATWKGLAMVSLPVIPGGTDPKPVVGFYANGWYAYNAAANTYATYPDHYTWFEPVESVRGRGFWARFSGEAPLPTGTTPAQNEPCTIHLSAGWNLIGTPFIAPVRWDVAAIKVQETGGSQISLKDARDLIYPFAWGWKQNASNPNTGSYDLVYDSAVLTGFTDSLQPWQGYWVKARKACDLILPAP